MSEFIKVKPVDVVDADGDIWEVYCLFHPEEGQFHEDDHDISGNDGVIGGDGAEGTIGAPPDGTPFWADEMDAHRAALRLQSDTAKKTP